MRLRDITICSICVLLAASLLIVAGMQLDFINSQRYEMKLISNEPLQNAPPSLAFATVAMGAFRGLVVDVLWMRADRLKEQGQFFDAKQLAEWITKLQPRFTSVWEFHAWNMAYNISVAIPATQPEERWRWVKNGYELLRDRGIPLNPKSIGLYHELARTFQHKIGSVSDDVHKYYKLQLALAIEPLLGPADDQYFKVLAAAPTELNQIIRDANIASFVNALKSADKTFENDDDFVTNYLSLRQNPHRFKPDAFKAIDDFRGTQALRKFDVFAKAHQLRNVWKLDPVLMKEINKTYGPIDFKDTDTHFPLDWRHPDTHAIYWAVKGLRVAGKKDAQTKDEMEYLVAEVNTDRMVYHSLQNLFRNGKIFIYRTTIPKTPDDSSPQGSQTAMEVFLRPDLRMFDPYNKAALKIIEKYTETQKEGLNSHQIGHRNMLKNAAFSFYQTGHVEQAQRIYNQLKKLYPSDEFKGPLVTFIQKRLREELTNIGLTNAREIVQLMLRESYFFYAMRDDDEAFAREKMAKETHDHYQSAYLDENRIDLPDFKLVRYFALLDFLQDEQFSPTLRKSLLARIKLERPEVYEQLMKQEEKILKQFEKSQ